ncbi:cystathionine beta-lyase [Pigmentiphaga soli]|uniref:Cystathionine beta-lyase n=1 Tax=Pigmentiphaga soli TaxID=1007095 RepID=A0ABP8GNI6_9BURK
MPKPDTLLAHAGRDPEKYAGMVNTPVFRTSTVIYPTIEAYDAPHDVSLKPVSYGRQGTPTTFAFEEAVARLEGGCQAVATPNGLSAILVSLLTVLRPGQHLLMSDSAYAPARSFCNRRLAPFGIDIEYYDPLIGAGIAGLLRDNTGAVFCESPGSLTFEVQDIPAIAAAAHARGIPVLADNTWATPYFQSPFELGIDFSIQAGTKYIGGHSDLMIGTVTTTERYWKPLRETVRDFAYSVSPDDCYLALRGLRTLGVRLRQQMQSALRVAQWLEGRPEVSRVLYPALPSHPGHELWRRDFRGAAALFSVVLKPMSDAALAGFVNGLRYFGIGSSWGGFESLITVVHAEPYRTATRWQPEGPAVRLHIGLEDPDDLIADLQRGLDGLSAAAGAARHG